MSRLEDLTVSNSASGLVNNESVQTVNDKWYDKTCLNLVCEYSEYIITGFCKKGTMIKVMQPFSGSFSKHYRDKLFFRIHLIFEILMEYYFPDGSRDVNGGILKDYLHNNVEERGVLLC